MKNLPSFIEKYFVLLLRKITQTINIGGQQPQNVIPTGALGTAVDRMSFAHDIVMMSDSSILGGDDDKPYKDPLRELILISEESSAKVDVNYATNLAKEASVLSHVKEIHLESNINASKATPKPPTVITVPQAASAVPPKDVSNLSVVFQDRKDTVDPIKEREFLIKLNAMEESESECMMNNDRPILGKVSLMRRAKSAVSRTIIDHSINDKHPLFSVKWDKQKSSSASHNGTKTSHTIDIDDDGHGSDDDIPTPEDVKRHMELFHLRRAQPPASAKFEENRKSKHSKTRSARTAKTNR